MDIFDVLDYGLVVMEDEDRRIVITYNGHATYNAWTEEGGMYHNFDVRTVYPSATRYSATLDEARHEAREWLKEMEMEG